MWNQQAGLLLCRAIENIAPQYGAHVALTGGLLYKEGNRKDADILFYRIRQKDRIDKVGLFLALQEKLGIVQLSGFGWCHKARWMDQDIDFFFPEADSSEVVLNDVIYPMLGGA